MTEGGAQVGGLFVPSTAETFLAGKVGEYATGSPSEGMELQPNEYFSTARRPF